MALSDIFVDEESIQDQRRTSDQIARERFDPDDLLPQLRQASDLASQGIADDQVRQKAINRIFNETNTSSADGSIGSGRTLSFLQQLNQQRTQQLGQTETEIGLQDEKAKQRGEQALAEVQSKREQIEGQRDARIRQNRLMAEAEAERRKKQFGSTIGGLTGSIAGSFLGPAGAAIGGSIGGGLFGGAEGAMAGGVKGVGTSMARNMINPDSENMGLDSILDVLDFNNATSSNTWGGNPNDIR